MKIGKFEFERFTEVGKRFAARVTIRQNGQLGFNEGARNLFGLAEYRYCVLFFDQVNRVVGILPTNEEAEEGKVPLVNDPKNTYLSAVSFLDRFGIERKTSSRYALQREGNVLYFDLGSPIVSREEDEKTAPSS